ncbi:M23 family metallopeptidase [Actinophytocola sp.]|uniref:M23 family metallopeptidase n=1 Tax=Actinophytocola sp. TaxID=1872138 RepID=UPI003D6C6C60
MTVRLTTTRTTRNRVIASLATIALVVGLVVTAPGASASGNRESLFPAFGLPFAPGQSAGSAGIHSDDGATGPKNAIDLTPSDGIVRAPLDGTVHIWQCPGGPWVTIDHVEGWRTGYYHMENIEVADGQQVAPGTVLGTIGNALPCGGSSSGAHVHFTLWLLTASPAEVAAEPAAGGDWHGVSYETLSSDVAAVVGEPVDGKAFGGWQFFEAATQYSGHAVRRSDGWVVPFPGTFLYG